MPGTVAIEVGPPAVVTARAVVVVVVVAVLLAVVVELAIGFSKPLKSTWPLWATFTCSAGDVGVALASAIAVDIPFGSVRVTPAVSKSLDGAPGLYTSVWS